MTHVHMGEAGRWGATLEQFPEVRFASSRRQTHNQPEEEATFTSKFVSQNKAV